LLLFVVLVAIGLLFVTIRALFYGWYYYTIRWSPWAKQWFLYRLLYAICALILIRPHCWFNIIKSMQKKIKTQFVLLVFLFLFSIIILLDIIVVCGIINNYELLICWICYTYILYGFILSDYADNIFITTTLLCCFFILFSYTLVFIVVSDAPVRLLGLIINIVSTANLRWR
jgi:hypothetical protein